MTIRVGLVGEHNGRPVRATNMYTGESKYGIAEYKGLTYQYVVGGSLYFYQEVSGLTVLDAYMLLGWRSDR